MISKGLAACARQPDAAPALRSGKRRRLGAAAVVGDAVAVVVLIVVSVRGAGSLPGLVISTNGE